MIDFRHKIDYRSLIFFTAFIMLILSGTFRMTMFVPHYRMIARMCTLFDYLPLLLVTVKVLFLDKFSNLNKLIFIGLGVILFYSSYISKSHDLANSYFLILGSAGINVKKIFKASFFTMFFVILLTILSSFIGLVPNLVYFRNGIFRMALGTIYPTILSSIIFFIMVAFVCWNIKTTNKRLVISSFTVISLLGLVMYILTDTRNDFICTMLLAVVILWRYYEKILKTRLLRAVVLVMPTIVFLWTMISGFFFNSGNATWNFFNRLFSNRLALVYYATNRYPVRLLGQSFNEHGNGYSLKPVKNYFFIDSSFSRVMLLNGMLSFILIYLAIQIAFYLIIKKEVPFLTAFLLVFIVAMLEGTFSTLFMTVAFNVTLFGLKVLLPERKRFIYD
ncbi:hypothetical protein [Fructilactobacillus cliffordii]|uniref:Polysaccharide polymerase n=1 Tax=Fructilactobacillus cliffordii TaxID=2940299 RepID=A0A9Q8ZP01_9LACO|nr:hypothetical protein [Fructilactobacillus cliffordii]USS85861.1 hypothetical protein M3M38_03900 [Fructilactobacillus cliffordii]USS88930.1 hypothetical protein M3M40_05435 [Fructilactobacillus cliffordii]